MKQSMKFAGLMAVLFGMAISAFGGVVNPPGGGSSTTIVQGVSSEVPFVSPLKLPLTYTDRYGVGQPVTINTGSAGQSNQFSGFGYGRTYLTDGGSNFVTAFIESYYVGSGMATGAVVIGKFDLHGTKISKTYIALPSNAAGWQDVSLFQTASNTWLAFYSDGADTTNVIQRSTDLVNWSVVTNFTHATTPTNMQYTGWASMPAQTANGTILAPLYGDANGEPQTVYGYAVWLVASTNDGLQWFAYSQVTTGPSNTNTAYNETSLLIVSTNLMQAYLRNASTNATNQCSLSTSTDNGLTWSAPVGILPLCNAVNPLLLPSGRIVLASRDATRHQGNGNALYPTIVYSSVDTGATWTVAGVLDYQQSWGCSLFDASNHNIGCVFGGGFIVTNQTTGALIPGGELRLAYLREGYGSTPVAPDAGWMALANVAFAGGKLWPGNDAWYGGQQYGNSAAFAGGWMTNMIPNNSVAQSGGIINNTGGYLAYGQNADSGGKVTLGNNAHADSQGTAAFGTSHADSSGTSIGFTSHADSNASTQNGAYYSHANSQATVWGYGGFGSVFATIRGKFNFGAGLGTYVGGTNNMALLGGTIQDASLATNTLCIGAGAWSTTPGAWMLSANGASTNAVTNSIALNAAQYILQNLTNADPHIKGALWNNSSVLSISAGP